jgi:hypothetical protein
MSKKKFSHLSWLQRCFLTDACQRVFLAVSDYRVGEDATIAADLFKMGVGGVVEHGGERYVYVEQTVKTIPIIYPTTVTQGIKRESDGLWVSADMIHKMVLSDRNLPLPTYPKFHQLSWWWWPWFVLMTAVGLIVFVAFAALVISAVIFLSLFLVLFSVFREFVWDRVQDSYDQFRAPRNRPVDGLSDDEAMKIAHNSLGHHEGERKA